MYISRSYSDREQIILEVVSTNSCTIEICKVEWVILQVGNLWKSRRFIPISIAKGLQMICWTKTVYKIRDYLLKLFCCRKIII